MHKDASFFIKKMTRKYEERIKRIPFLNIDTFIIPSPYITDNTLEIDYDHSYVWDEEGEIMGYLLVYSNPAKSKFQIYKQVTSPFGRGKGIGTTFLDLLVQSVAPDALVYLYVWEKKVDSIDFFLGKGFVTGDSIVYRQLIFYYMSAKAEDIREKSKTSLEIDRKKVEEIGKTRHDARKILKLLIDMVDMLSIDNCARIIEDINRESSALINMLNSYEDKIEIYHREIDLRELILERVVSYINVSTVPCEVKLHFYPRTPHVYAHYVEVGRALINVVSNSLDAIRKAECAGIISITLQERENIVYLIIEDNGIGIDEDRLQIDEDGLPVFVGQTTKNNKSGTGIGTKQIFSTFGTDNIKVESKKNQFTRWTIKLTKVAQEKNKMLLDLEQRYHEFQNVYDLILINKKSTKTEISSFIWQLRKMEIFLFDLIFQYSKYNNIRTIYRALLSYLYGSNTLENIQVEIAKYRVDHQEITIWLLDMIQKIKNAWHLIEKHVAFTSSVRGVLLKSFGQAQNCTIIFTMNPENGHLFATDRKLAEHLDFVPYLGKDRDELLRGEFKGDLRKDNNPIYLGVWSVSEEYDLYSKLRLIRKGAERLIEMGLHPQKRLNFYHTTYNLCQHEIDTYKTITLETMIQTKDDQLDRFIIKADDELEGYVFTD
ncbi:MAG: GNAT family N-acetyltransferase [Spirochaetes bacterium]|nr:GNAT family N-acetyltransferase [Spirochaetota bacterium]